MKNEFTRQFNENIKGIYSCFDRVIIRGYVHKLFFEGGVVNFLRAAGFKKHTRGVMRIFTDQLNKHIEKAALKLGIDIVWWNSVDGGKNGAKQEYVEKHYVRNNKKRGNFVYCIIAAMERTVSFTTRSLAKKDGGSYDKVYKCRKIVKHYYIYFHDRLLGGPCYLKLCTYFPFNVEFYFNGHNAVRLKLDAQGVKYRMKDNSFIWVEDIEAIQKIAFSLSGRQIQERINYWMNRFFKFDKGKYSTCPRGLHHEWYCSQVEVCSNIIFKSARFGTSLFERILDKFMRIGQPDSLVQIFEKRKTSKPTKSVHRLYDHLACVKHWLGGNSIKAYNKCGYLLRIESTINSPKLLGLKKHLLHIRDYLRRGIGNNDRLMSRYADVDAGSISDGEASLFTQRVLLANGIQVSAPDLRKERQLRLLKAILNPKYAAEGFRTVDLLHELSEYFENSGQIRYELQKLRVRRVVNKVQGKQSYRVTELGVKLLWINLASNLYFCNPLITMTYGQKTLLDESQPSKLEEAYRLLNRGLDLISRELYIRRAA
jgi:hypothetical protein